MSALIKNLLESIVNIILAIICKKTGSDCGDNCSYKG